MNHALMNEICRDNNSYQNNEVTYYELASEVAESLDAVKKPSIYKDVDHQKAITSIYTFIGLLK